MTEDQYIQEMCNILKEKSQKDYKSGNTKRSAHAKCLGLLKANFIVSDNLPEELKVGIFKDSRSYPCLIRVSNSSPKLQGDNKKDIRGFSIKLLDVLGEKFINDEKNTHDFLLVSTKTMPLGTVKLFYEALYYNIKVNPGIYLLRMIAQGNLGKLKDVVVARKHHSSPLDIEYFSTTPYKFNAAAVKYCIVPTSKYKSKLPDKLTSTYLTDNMQKHLNNHVATFDFMVQFQKGNMPTEDAAVEWSELESPFIKVGEILINKQNFNTSKRYDLAENLSFTPGHSLIEHKPIEGINRARVGIYNNLSLFRHQRNNQSVIEPTLKDFDNL